MEVTHDKHFTLRALYIIISQNKRTLGTDFEWHQSPESGPQIICMEDDDVEELQLDSFSSREESFSLETIQ